MKFKYLVRWKHDCEPELFMESHGYGLRDGFFWFGDYPNETSINAELVRSVEYAGEAEEA